jgi:hypothetical protein
MQVRAGAYAPALRISRRLLDEWCHKWSRDRVASMVPKNPKITCVRHAL